MMGPKMLYVPVNFRFHNTIIFSYRFFCSADHIYDNSTIVRTDLGLMRVFWVDYGYVGPPVTLVPTHP